MARASKTKANPEGIKENTEGAEFINALSELAKSKHIDPNMLLEEIAHALEGAYKRDNGEDCDIQVSIDANTGKRLALRRWYVTNEIITPDRELTVEEARQINPEAQEGDIVGKEVSVSSDAFNRVAAQAAKGIIVQKIREQEHASIYERYQNISGELIDTVIQRVEKNSVTLDYTDSNGEMAEAYLSRKECIPKEQYTPGSHLKVYVMKVEREKLGAQIVVSRAAAEFVKKLFENEVAEINRGIVEIVSISREAGFRTKIAVKSNRSDVDPIGACVGPRGSRVERVVAQINGEKIDIVRYSDNPAVYIANALSPAKVDNVWIDEDNKAAAVLVPDSQLSLAIGREGQNARLAVRLTGWKIDIKDHRQMAEQERVLAQQNNESADKSGDSQLDI